MTVKEYDDVVDAAYFIRVQAYAMIEEADCAERAVKAKARAFLGDQDARVEALLPLRHRLLCKERGYDVPIDGPLPSPPP